MKGAGNAILQVCAMVVFQTLHFLGALQNCSTNKWQLQSATNEVERLASRLSDVQSDLKAKDQMLSDVTSERVRNRLYCSVHFNLTSH